MKNFDVESISIAVYCRTASVNLDEVNRQRNVCFEYIERKYGKAEVRDYTDSGVSGLSVDDRSVLQRMMQDSEKSSFDMVVTADISCISRDIEKAIDIISKFKSMGTDVCCIAQDFSTLDKNGELQLVIMKALLQGVAPNT